MKDYSFLNSKLKVGGTVLPNRYCTLFNKRDDEYGGTLENRLRAAKEIVEGIHRVCEREFPVSICVYL